MGNTLKLHIALRSEYTWYVFALCLLFAFPLRAQNSEQDLRKQAEDSFDNGDYVSAMPLYSQLLSLNPTNATYNYKYGASALYGDADKKQESIKFLRFASQNPGVDPEVWYFLGRAYHLNYFFDDAINAYEKYASLASSRDVEQRQVNRRIAACRAGLGLLEHVKDITVLGKKSSTVDAFFRLYDLSDIGGKILVTPDALLSKLDKKNGHRSLIHYRGAGSVVYFSSYGSDGKNGLDIYRANVLPGGTFSKPERLPATINSPYDEDYPYMHADGKRLYFSSKGHGSMGGYDVFKSVMGPGGFTRPENLDFAVNTPDDDMLYVVDSLNRLANFASSRSSPLGELNVYRVEVEAAPLSMVFVKGDFVNKIDPGAKAAKITVADAAGNEEVTVQYTDPQTGAYVLDFPRGGRYKFLVEAKGSKRVHTGIVDVPLSEGVKAYLQEMELISVAGTEKLLINNRFDQTFEGDIAALARDFLRRKAELDVNFNDVPEVPLPVADSTGKEEEFDLAYNDAGFGAGLSNETVLQQAEERTQTLDRELEALNELAVRAELRGAQSLTNAEELLSEAQAKKASAMELNTAGDPAAYKAMFEAGVAKQHAENAFDRARNANALRVELDEQLETLQAKRDLRRAQTDSLQTALGSGDYDRALSALKREKSRREAEDKVADRSEPVKTVRAQSIEARNEARAGLERASALREASDKMEAKLRNAKRRNEKSGGKDGAEAKAEIAELTEEVQRANSRAAKAFEAAEALQHNADDLQQRYEIVADIHEALNEVPPADRPSEGEPWNEENAANFKDAFQSVDVDEEMVANYLKANPGALDESFEGLAANEFRKSYAVAGQGREAEPVDEGVPTSPTSTPDARQDLTAQAEETNAGTDSDESSAPQEQQRDRATVVTSEDTSDGSVGNPRDAGEYGENEAPTVADTAQIAALPEPAEGRSEAKGLGSGDEREASTSGETLQYAENEAPDENSRGGDEGGDEGVASTSAEGEDAAVGDESLSGRPETAPAVTEEIRAERDKMEMARNWLDIIDQNIADLQSEGSVENAEDRDQLAQYQSLRQEKTRELESSQQRIAQLESGNILPETDGNDEALGRAMADVDTLDASLTARLEMHVPDMTGKTSVRREVDVVDPAYRSDMAAAEMSGLSAPEIADERIAINERFIAKAEVLLQNPDDTELTGEDVLALRRKAALAIKQDRQIREGSLAYTPRTPEAREYADMIAPEAEGQLAPAQNTAGTDGERPNAQDNALSPELAEDLSQDYRRSLALPGYDESLSAVEQTADTVLRKELRAELNRDYLRALGSEIKLYQAALNVSPDGDARLQERYGILLAERSKVVDEIAADTRRDEVLLASANDNQPPAVPEFETEKQPRTEPMENGSAEVEDFEAPTDAATETPDEAAPAQSAEAYRYDFLRLRDDIEVQSLDPGPRLDSLIALNAKFASDIDLEVQRLMTVIDDPYTRYDRDSLQSEIAALDALAADKRQESDRLKSQKDQWALLPPPSNADETEAPTRTASQTQPEETPESEAPVQNPPVLGATDAGTNGIPFDSAMVVADGIAVREILYRSLNANIRREGLDTKLDSAEALADRIEGLENQLEKADGTDNLHLENELSYQKTRLSELNRELLLGLDASNATELEYYADENQRMLDEISSENGQGLDSIGPANLSRAEVLSELGSLSGDESTDHRKKLASMTDAELGDRVELDLDRIERLAEIYEYLEQESETLQAANETMVVAQRDINSESEPQGTDPDAWTEVDNPENYRTLAGKTYLSPIQITYGETLSPQSRQELMASDAKLQRDLSFAQTSAPDEVMALIEAGTQLDRADREALVDSPRGLEYILSAVRADSLKAMESRSAAYAEKTMDMARERAAEVKRLNGTVALQDNKDDKKLVLQRAERIKAEAETLFGKSAIAAEQAEQSRELRKLNEEKFARAAVALTASQRREFDALLTGPVYAVVPPAPTREAPVSEAVEPEGELASNKSDANESAVDAVPANEKSEADSGNLPPATEAEYQMVVPDGASADFVPEEVRNMTRGNWLGVVDIIAEKDDFSDVDGSMFITANEAVYSENTPIPIDPAMPQGLVFQVQVGAYRNKIPQDLFGEFAPVMGQQLDNGITRYRAGLFKAYGQAAEARDRIRAKGYDDAFVVAYLDGDKMSGSQARDILAQARETENYSPPEIEALPTSDLPAVSGAKDSLEVPDYYNDPTAAAATQVEVTKGLFFTVQVGVYSKPVKLDKLYNLDHLNSELTSGGLIRYTTGRFASVRDAGPKKAEAREKGVKDAFVTAYFDGKRIPVGEALTLLSQKGEAILAEGLGAAGEKIRTSVPTGDGATPTSTAEVTYVVVMGRYTEDVPQALANFFLERPDLNIHRTTDSDGEAVYVSSEFDNMAQAQRVLELSHNAGIDTAVLGHVVGGEVRYIQGE